MSLGILDADRRVLTLALARMADALGNSFLIIVLPLYVASGQIPLDPLVGTRFLGFVVPEIAVGGSALFEGFRFEGILVTKELLIGLVLSLFGFLNSLGQPITGRISDRTGKRKLYILIGLGVFGTASASYPFVHDYSLVLVVRALQGVGAALTIPSTIALVNEYAGSDTERGGSFGVFNTFRLIGFGFGPIVAGGVVAAGPYPTPFGSVSGFNAAFLVAVVGAVVSFVLVAVFINDPEREDKGEEAGQDDLSFSLTDEKGLGLDPVFVLGLGTLFMAVTVSLFATLQEGINTRLAQSSFAFGIEFAVVVLANVVLQVPVGSRSDVHGRRPFIVGGFALLVPSMVAQGYILKATLPWWTMLLARLVQGTALALVFAPSLALAGDLAKKGRSGSTLSVLTMGFGLGIAVGPLASGFLARYGISVPFFAGAGLAAVALALVYSEVEDTVSGTEAQET